MNRLSYSQLCDLVEKHLPNNIDPKIVYFIAGIPDICTLTRYTNTVNCMLGTKTIRANLTVLSLLTEFNIINF
jgi:hypothetical protein